MKLRFAIIVLLLFAAVQPVAAQHTHKHHHATHQQAADSPKTSKAEACNRWADSVMDRLSLEERVAQLMVVRVPLSMDAKQKRKFEKLFTESHVGGVCFFAGNCTNQLEQTKRYQHLSDVPLMVCIDAERGLGSRLSDAYSFPRQMMMGALIPRNDSLIYQMGTEVALQCRKMGVHVNFAPVVDLNSNPLNPVIGMRSFGENKVRVSNKGKMYVRGLQNHGVMAVAKHFPGHGDTETDSHADLPVIKHSKAVVDTIDTYPFRQMIRCGVRGIMVAHLQVNAYDTTRNLPSSLSPKLVNQLLRKDMGYKGLVFTDGIDMKAVTKNYPAGQAELMAIQAGNDIVLLPPDPVASIKLIVETAKADTAFARQIDEKCRRVLREKYKLGLNNYCADSLSIPTKADRSRCEEITTQIATKAFTLLRNDDILPFRTDEQVVYYALGNVDTSLRYLTQPALDRIAQANAVVISLYLGVNASPSSRFGITTEQTKLMLQIQQANPRILLVVYGSPYALDFLPAEFHPAAIVMAYQNMPEVRSAIRPLLRGTAQFEGRLPVSAGGFREGEGLRAHRKPPYNPDKPLLDAHMDTACFRAIDSIALRGIAQKAYPGCRILVAKDGKVVYNRSYGRQTYDEDSPAVDSATIYDLASLTKVCATNFAVMKLYDAGKISLDDPLSRYLPYLKHTNKSKITVRQVLSHNARLIAFDAFWKNVDITQPNPERRLNVMLQIAKSKLAKEDKYLYSDLGFMLLADMVRSVTGQTVDIFMQQQFYEPMGLTNTTFCPMEHGFDTNRIAPTGKATDYRKGIIRGEVNDPNAAAMGGVAGHAGLFSTADDLCQLYFMMLNGGVYKGHRYLEKSTLDTFNQRYYSAKGNRRSLGYDKPFIHGRSTHCAPEASQSSFGHTGFTGTMVWVDPDSQLIYIFLSNRTQPDASVNRLAQLNIRTDIQSLIYKSLKK